MPSSFVEAWIRGVEPSHITDVFLILLVAIFFLAYWFKRNHTHAVFTAYAPTLLTSLGILGTFVGIISGLLDFDTNDIDGSIGPLLEGLKTAFISSIAGMFLSILYKAGVSFGILILPVTRVEEDDEVDSLDFYKVMQQQVESISDLKRAIAGDDESSLMGVLKLQRSDINDHFKALTVSSDQVRSSLEELTKMTDERSGKFDEFSERLWKEMSDFGDLLSKSATQQVIEALNQVIQDFNNQLTEQFGENFKELNAAVLELVKWQENYKHQLSDMSEKYALGVEAISKTEESVTSISAEAKTIPIAMDSLKTVLEVNQHQIDELDKHLVAFSDIRDRAVEAVPEIREQIDGAIAGAREANETLAAGMLESANEMHKVLANGTEEFGNNVATINAGLTSAADETAKNSIVIQEQFSTALEDINNHMRNLLDELQKEGASLNESFAGASTVLKDETTRIARDFESGLSEMAGRLEETIHEQAQSHRNQADSVFNALEKTIEQSLKATGESVQKQIDIIDQTSEQQTKKVMEAMGGALASISSKFTNDYKELVDKMNQIVRQR
ncbi:hypothetical protein A3750_04770 [Oleiphilus sp. HI0079]|uniref:hypothetical protein n=1 Tax=Oleiphilus sp. HI0079 TaxID=1822254 RepID=UPI0007C37AD8|nr:hypothetical protein [Oleiphilus sp. HI0079]KZZ12838.1 hypothetical protein A3750_04770 [Oleiphilus sp. HI0079]